MSPTRTTAALAALFLVSCSYKKMGSPEISVSNAWSRATAEGQSSAAVYFALTNKGEGNDRLVKVSTSVGEASLHSTSMANGVMRMRPVGGLAIAGHSTVELKPDGIHVMITGMKQPLQIGQHFQLTLNFQKSGPRDVTVTIQPATTNGTRL